MNLLLDLGNTRIKWALADQGCRAAGLAIVQRGVARYEAAELASLQQQLDAANIRQVQYASVIDTEQEHTVVAALLPEGVQVRRFRVAQQAGSLSNAYATPETLGVDRWAAAVGAWGLCGVACLVISAGTATTIDLIETTASGNAIYRGGLILPGMDLMLQSLHQRAARLPLAAGRYRAAPDIADNTHDAIRSGALEATAGAIERMGQRLPVGAPWLITGGAAPLLQEVLGDRVRFVEDLVLAGLALELDDR